jgi:surfeit locus 1 family protein
VDAGDDEYRRLQLSGMFRHDQTTLVDALTELGPGHWVMTPLVTGYGTILVNRGFVAADDATRDFSSPRGQVTVTGLLRLSEPEGRFLRPNRPQAGIWYSRDVPTIAAARKLGPVAPFFVDAEAAGAGISPVGGLTVVRFRDVHLIYALTWLALAGVAAFGAWRVLREPRR